MSTKVVPKKRGRAKKSETVGEDESAEPITKKAKVASRKGKSSGTAETIGNSDGGTLLPPKRRGKEKKATVKPDSKVTASDDEESSSPPSETELTPKRKRPQRRAASSHQPVTDQAWDGIESGDSEKQEDDVDTKPAKRRKNVAENSTRTKAKKIPKSKEINSVNVSVPRSSKAFNAYQIPDKTG